MAAPTASSSVPPDVTDWPATPAPFNAEKHGERALFSGDGSVVRRRQHTEGLRDCVVFSGVPLPLGLVWQITVVDTIPDAKADKIMDDTLRGLFQPKESQIKRQYKDTVRIQQRQYKALEKQMLATVPKEQHREVLRQTNEELLRKTAMLAIQYERTIADMAQNQRSRMTPLNNGLVVGVTSSLPEQVPSYLDSASDNEWLYKDRVLIHSAEETDFPHLESLDIISPGESVGLLLTATGSLHIYFNGKLVERIATGLPVNQPLWGVVDVYGTCIKVKSEVLGVGPEQILQAALRDGFILHKDDVFLIHGPGGVGKSSLIDVFLGKTRDLTRHSTQLATEPLHLQPFRDVSTRLFTGEWQVVNYERMSRMIAHTSDLLSRSTKGVRVEGNEEGEGDGEESDAVGKGDVKKGVGEGEGTEGETETSAITTSGAFLATPTVGKSSKKGDVMQIAFRFRSTLSNILKKSPKSLTTTLGDDPDDIEGIFTSFQQGLHDFIRESRDANDVLFTHSIRILDSGGQPQFHELVSIFLPGITGIISVFKLSECLAVHGEVAFYRQGRCTNEPYESYYSNEQVIRHDLQAIRSEAVHTGMEEMPNLAFVGTFRDKQDACKESPGKKDERLHTIITEILPEKMQQCVITNGKSLKQVTFQVNAREPEDQDFEAVGRLKEALTNRSRAKTRNLPLKWHGLEVALHMLMKELGRQSLRRTECEFVGYKLGFDHASLNAALDYLRKLNIISFYDDLQDVIFGSSQVVLDRITDLVRYSLELKSGKHALDGAERKFVQQGIISLDFLKSRSLAKHYSRELFEPEDLLKILISQLVVSEVGKKEYFVPCVLEVSSVYPSPPPPKGSFRSSFILLFSKETPMCGIYCCTIASLLSDAGWKLLAEGGEVVQVARNSVIFAMPKGFPGKITFRDPLSSYLEVIVEFPASKHCTSLYHKIRNVFLVAIKKAVQTLHYEVEAPDVSFLCPEQSSRCSALPHPATVDDTLSFLKCSLKPGSVWRDLTSEQMMWLLIVTGLRHQTPVTESSKSPIAERTVTASTIQGETPERGDPLHQRSSTTAEQGPTYPPPSHTTVSTSTFPAPATSMCIAGLYDEISDRDLAIIARDHLIDWESLRPFLGLSRSKEREITKSYPGDYGRQKQECLELWQEVEGKAATYCALIKAAEEARARDLADIVRTMLKRRQTTAPDGDAASLEERGNGVDALHHLSDHATQQVTYIHGAHASLQTQKCHDGTGMTDYYADQSPSRSGLVHSAPESTCTSQHIQPQSLLAQSTAPKSSAITGEQPIKQPLPFGGQRSDKGHAIEQPSLPLLYKLNVPEQVGMCFKKFGTLLLNDGTGVRVSSIEDEFRGNHEKITTRILESWLKGEGLSVTWETLVDTLRACNLNTLADNILALVPTN